MKRLLLTLLALLCLTLPAWAEDALVIDGVTWQEIDMTRSLATYTSDKVTFWQNGVEVAWFSNSELVTTALNVADRITLGGLWEVSRRNGFTIKWIGGDA